MLYLNVLRFYSKKEYIDFGGDPCDGVGSAGLARGEEGINCGREDVESDYVGSSNRSGVDGPDGQGLPHLAASD